MIKLENWEVVGWEHAIRGMRNPKNSWDRSDSFECIHNTPIFEPFCTNCIHKIGEEPHDFCNRGENTFVVGPNDHKLMMQLAKGGPVHAKYRRMIVVYVDITAPLYWWKEFDTYKVGTVANSCSTMHKIHDKEFTIEDFSVEKITMTTLRPLLGKTTLELFHNIIDALNYWRDLYNETKEKLYWEQMIQLLPTSYNQKRTVMLSYEVLANMHHWRKKIPHKLDEWLEFGDWIESLPYSEIITGENVNDDHGVGNGETGEEEKTND